MCKRLESTKDNSYKKYAKTPKVDVPKFVPKLGKQRPHAGYIVLKDKGLVTIYSNDLAGTPSKPLLLGTEAEAIQHVHGLIDISRWL
jgi:hypothetical protein